MNYGWLLLRVEGEEQQHYKAGGNWNSSFLSFPISVVPWVQGCSLLAVLCPKLVAKPSFCRTYELCTEDLIYVQLMLWFQCSCIIAGTEQWFINSGHCVFPMHERKTKKVARTANFFLEFWKGIKHAHNDPYHNQLHKTCECPCITRPGSLLDHLSLETPNPSYFQMDEIHAAVHTDFHYISKQSRSHSAKLREELLKTHRISVMLRKHHSWSTQKRCLPSCEAVMLFQDTYANSGGSYSRERVRSNREAPCLPLSPHTGSDLGHNSSLFLGKGEGDRTSFLLV